MWGWVDGGGDGMWRGFGGGYIKYQVLGHVQWEVVWHGQCGRGSHGSGVGGGGGEARAHEEGREDLEDGRVEDGHDAEHVANSRDQHAANPNRPLHRVILITDSNLCFVLRDQPGTRHRYEYLHCRFECTSVSLCPGGAQAEHPPPHGEQF